MCIRDRDVAEHVPQYRPLYEAAETQFPGATARERFHECLRNLVDKLVSGLIAGTVARAAAAGAQTVDDVRAFPERLAAFAPEAAETSRALKSFLHRRVYISPSLMDGRNRSTAMIGGLFEFFVENPGGLPEPYRLCLLYTSRCV